MRAGAYVDYNDAEEISKTYRKTHKLLSLFWAKKNSIVMTPQNYETRSHGCCCAYMNDK